MAALVKLGRAVMLPLVVLFAGLLTGWYAGSGRWGAALFAGACAVYALTGTGVPRAIGTRTVLWGYHTFWLHPWFVALAWWRLYGFPWDPRLWVAFVVHDLGYWGLPNLDGPEGEQHPEWGARLMGRWFDTPLYAPGRWTSRVCDRIWGLIWARGWNAYSWSAFARYHSRFLARGDGEPYSALCVADKLAITLYPRWLFLFLVRATGEVEEYMATALRRGEHPTAESIGRWYRGMTAYVGRWVEEHRDLRPDHMTRDDSKSGFQEGRD